MKMARRILKDFRRALRHKGLNTVDVTLIWDDAPVPTDPNDEAMATTGAQARETVRGLFHFTGTGGSIQSGMLETAEGDAILDLDPSVNLNRRNLRFVIDGATYAQKRNAKDVTEDYDTYVGGERMCRTVPLVLVPPTEAPRLIGVQSGIVRYRTSAEDVALYAYNLTTGIFTASQPTGGRAIIWMASDGTHVFFITFNGVKALGIRADGTLECAHILADGGTGPASLPALDFYMGAVRYGSITASGILTVPEVDVAAADPEAPESFRIADAHGAWLATLGCNRLQVRATATL